MNKYDSKTGVTMFLIMALLCFATIFFYILWATSGIWVPAIVFSVILLVGFCPIYFCTNYEIDSTFLHVRMGFFKKSIPLEKIEAVYPTKNWALSFATSYQRIAIIYSDNEKIKRVYVSPFLYAAFLNDLTDMTLDSAILANPTDREAFMAQQNNAEEEQVIVKKQTKKAGKTKKIATKKQSSEKTEKTVETEKQPAKKKAGRPKKAETKKSVGRPKKTESKKPVGRPKKAPAKRPVGRPKKKV